MKAIIFNKRSISQLGFTFLRRSKTGNMVSFYGIANNIPQIVKNAVGTHLYGNVSIHHYQVDNLQPSIEVTICYLVKHKHAREFQQTRKVILRTMIDPRIDMKDYIWSEVRAFYKKEGIY